MASKKRGGNDYGPPYYWPQGTEKNSDGVPVNDASMMREGLLRSFAAVRNEKYLLLFYRDTLRLALVSVLWRNDLSLSNFSLHRSRLRGITRLVFVWCSIPLKRNVVATGLVADRHFQHGSLRDSMSPGKLLKQQGCRWG